MGERKKGKERERDAVLLPKVVREANSQYCGVCVVVEGGEIDPQR